MSNPQIHHRRANIDLDAVVARVRKEGQPIDVRLTLLRITANHAVTESHVEKRLQKWLEVYSKELELVDGILMRREPSKETEAKT